MDTRNLSDADLLLFHIYWWRTLNAPPKGRAHYIFPPVIGFVVYLIAMAVLIVALHLDGRSAAILTVLAVVGATAVIVIYSKMTLRRDLRRWLENQDGTTVRQQISSEIAFAGSRTE
jgi:hypothetical protein